MNFGLEECLQQASKPAHALPSPSGGALPGTQRNTPRECKQGSFKSALKAPKSLRPGLCETFVVRLLGEVGATKLQRHIPRLFNKQGARNKESTHLGSTAPREARGAHPKPAGRNSLVNKGRK